MTKNIISKCILLSVIIIVCTGMSVMAEEVQIESLSETLQIEERETEIDEIKKETKQSKGKTEKEEQGEEDIQETETEEEKEDTIPVTDVEISDYEKELEVDKTIILSATVIPTNASESIITYTSSDPSVATVNSTGEVKGVSKGEVTIFCCAGQIKKEAHIKVKVATKQLCVNKDYLVLKPEESFQLKTNIVPAEASQEISYQSVDSEIAAVSSTGIITAKKCGSTNILVSNKDVSVSVSVIVNANEYKHERETNDVRHDRVNTETYPTDINAECISVITPDMLKYYYQEKKTVTISGNGYCIRIRGDEICNYENELYTTILFEKTEQGVIFEINNGQELCGEIELDLMQYNGDYLYLFNTSKEKYQLLEMQSLNNLHITQPGKYLLSKEKIKDYKVKRAVFAGSVVVLMVISGIYIVIKKKYWFW